MLKWARPTLSNFGQNLAKPGTSRIRFTVNPDSAAFDSSRPQFGHERAGPIVDSRKRNGAATRPSAPGCPRTSLKARTLIAAAPSEAQEADSSAKTRSPAAGWRGSTGPEEADDGRHNAIPLELPKNWWPRSPESHREPGELRKRPIGARCFGPNAGRKRPDFGQDLSPERTPRHKHPGDFAMGSSCATMRTLA